MNVGIIFSIFLLFVIFSVGVLSNSFVNAQSEIPDWIKGSADWWAQGLVTDKEFASSLGFLVKEKIIHVENVEVSSDGGIVVSDNLKIPEWIRNNAEWWASGAISDSDFKSGIQFMIKEDILSFKDPALDKVESSDKTRAFGDRLQEKILATGSAKTLNYDKKIADIINLKTQTPQKKLTLLVYMVGSDLEHDVRSDVVSDYFATKNIEEMIAAEPDSDINVVLATGGSKKAGIDSTRKIDFSKVSISRIDDTGLHTLTPSLGTRSMSSPELLTDFITWSVKTFPAEKYVLILWDHGFGARGYSHDNVAGQILRINALNTALDKAYENTERQKFELIGFDACYMATIEVADKIYDNANYMAASQESEPGSGWDYNAIINALNKNPEQNGADLGKIIIGSYYDKTKLKDKEEGKNFAPTSTASVIHLENFDQVVTAKNTFANSLLQIPKDEYHLISSALDQTEKFGTSSKADSSHKDLKGFADLIGVYFPKLAQSASTLSSAIKGVIPLHQMEGERNVAGLSFYFPLQDSANSDNLLNILKSKEKRKGGTDTGDSLLEFAEFKIVDKYFQYLNEDDNKISDFQVTQSQPGIFTGNYDDNDIQSLTFYFVDVLDEEEDTIEVMSNYEIQLKPQSHDFTFTWDGREPSLCNNVPVCFPINPSWDLGIQNQFVYLPVLIYPSINQLEPRDAIDGDLIYDVTNLNNPIFVGFTPVGSEGVSKQVLPLTKGNIVQILAYDVNTVTDEVEYTPVSMLEVDDGFRFDWKVYQWGALDVFVELCDFSGNCVLKKDPSFVVDSEQLERADWNNGIPTDQYDPLAEYLDYGGEYVYDDSYEWDDYDLDYSTISMSDYCNQLHKNFDSEYGSQEVSYICEDIAYDFGSEIDVYTAEQIIDELWYEIKNPLEYEIEEDIFTIDEFCMDLHDEFDDVIGINEVETICMQVEQESGYYLSFETADEIWYSLEGDDSSETYDDSSNSDIPYGCYDNNDGESITCYDEYDEERICYEDGSGNWDDCYYQ